MVILKQPRMESTAKGVEDQEATLNGRTGFCQVQIDRVARPLSLINVPSRAAPIYVASTFSNSVIFYYLLGILRLKETYIEFYQGQ